MKLIILTILLFLHLNCYNTTEYISNSRNYQNNINSKQFPLNHPNSYYNRLLTNDYLRQMLSDEIQEARINHKIKKKKKKNKLQYSPLHQHQLFHQQQQQQQLNSYSDPCRYLGRNLNEQNNIEDKPQSRFLWDLNIYHVYPTQKPQYIKPIAYPIPILLNGCNNFGFGTSQINDGLSLAGLSNIHGNGNREGHSIQNKPFFNALFNNLNDNDNSDEYNNNNNNYNNNNYNNNNNDPVYNNNNNNDPVYNNNNNNNNNNDFKPVMEDTEEETDNNNSNFPIRQFGQLIGGVANRVNDVIQIFTGNGERGPLIKSIDPLNIRRQYF